MKTFGPDHIYSILDRNKPYRGHDSDAACWSMAIYGAVVLLLFYGTTQNFRIGLPLLALWLILPWAYWDVRDRFDRWYVGRYVGPVTLLVSTSEPKPGEALDVGLAQTFRQNLTIEYLTLELIMNESWGGKDHYIGQEVIHAISQTDRPVQADQTYKTNVTFLIPHDAKPTQSRPEAEGYDLHWVIRVILKCQNVDALTTGYLITVVDGATPP
jgi:hypothetical protein